jgi:EAL domain-containing protein (putative c-di-GMP-specific phosphodiesterase class I)/ActR/RegA family two-component response regulator
MNQSVDPLRALLLVPDDEEDISHQLRSVAGNLGFEVSICSDYNSVESIIERRDPVVLFLDLQFGRRDGVEVLALLSRKRCESRIFIIGSMDETILKSACRVGLQFGLDMGGYWQKPIETACIEKHLALELDKRSRFSSEKLREVLGPGEFVIQYHPIIVVSADRDSAITGVEVRPHWENRQGSTVWLSNLLPAMLENSLLSEFNYLLMDKALESYCDWHQIDRELGITVCMHDSNLMDSNWPDRMIDIVDKWKVPHELITFAIEQHAMKEESGYALAALTRLRISGFNIALDTMGNDIEELDELLNIPFSELRLKRTLVEKIGKDMEFEFNVSTLVSLAIKRNIQTCAVGVKTPEAFTYLQDCGCNTATGSLFGKSLPVTHVEKFFEREFS